MDGDISGNAVKEGEVLLGFMLDGRLECAHVQQGQVGPGRALSPGVV